jgi:hypothetical protein
VRNHSSSVLDFDVFSALHLDHPRTVVCTNVHHANPTVEGTRTSQYVSRSSVDGSSLDWVASFTASMKYQPATRTCLGLHSRNASSMVLPSSCTFSCRNATTSHSMRSGQHTVLVSKLGGYCTGPGQTDRWVIAGSVLITLFVFIGFLMACLTSVFDYARDKINSSRSQQDLKSLRSGSDHSVQDFVLDFILVVWFMEDALKMFLSWRGGIP